MTQERRGEEGEYTRESKRGGRIKVPIIKGRMIFLGVDVSANSFLNVIPLALFHSGCVTCADMGGCTEWEGARQLLPPHVIITPSPVSYLNRLMHDMLLMRTRILCLHDGSSRHTPLRPTG